MWIAGGILTLCGALSLAELGSIYPGAGGLYVYLREVYGGLPAFLYGWGLLTMIHSGSIAALAVGFGVYFAHVLSLGVGGQRAIAVACIALLTGVNCLGIRPGKLIQNIFTVIKLIGIGAMIVLLFAHGARTGLFQASLHGPISVPSPALAGAALVAILWGYEGWHVVSFAAGEMKRPRIDLPRSLAIGTAIIAIVYLLANASYYSVLTPLEVRSNQAVAAVAMGKSYGAIAGISIAVLILISVLGSMNGMVLTGPRVYYAMAQDGLFLQRFGRINVKYRTPTFALMVQGLWAVLLSCSNSYQQLFTDVIFAAWFFYGLTVAGVVVLRRSQPNLNRPYRVPGFPWVPLFFCIASAGIVLSTIIDSPGRSAVGIGLILTGIPLFLLFRRRSRMHG
jgi:APA family basic amino acid/polyamine antiporter